MDADTGNPWLAIPKTYKGKFEVAAGEGVTLTTPYIMLSSDNDVSFMGNATCDTYTAGETLFTLPEECCPDVGVSVCVPATFTRSTGGGTEQRRIQFTIPEQSTTVTIAEQTVKVTADDVDTTATISVPSVSGEYTEPIVMDVGTDGRCTLAGEYVNLTLLLVGNSFNIGCNWYRLEA